MPWLDAQAEHCASEGADAFAGDNNRPGTRPAE
jgi:hypothetical protein